MKNIYEMKPVQKQNPLNTILPTAGEALKRVLPHNGRTIVVRGNVIYMPKAKYYRLFRLVSPLRARPTYVMFDNTSKKAYLITYLPEQQQPRINIIPSQVFWGDIKSLTAVIPSAR